MIIFTKWNIGSNLSFSGEINNTLSNAVDLGMMSVQFFLGNPYTTQRKNINDNDIEKKCNQLIQLGFKNVYGYTGGLYQWLLHQDIYGEEHFPTTSKCDDMLLYKETNHFQSYLLK